MSSDSSEASEQSSDAADDQEDVDEDVADDAAAPVESKGKKRERQDAVEAEGDGAEALTAKTSRKKAKKKKRKDFDAERTVFAGKIPYAAEEDDIRTFFSECGSITRLRMMLANHKFNGAVFVEFATAAEAKRALAMDGEMFLKRQIRVNMAELKPDASGAQSGFKVYVGNLAFTTSEKLLRAIFGHCGDILKIKLPLWRDTGRLRGFAIIDLDTSTARDRALKLHGMKVEGRVITVEPMQKADKSGKKGKKSVATRSKTVKIAAK